MTTIGGIAVEASIHRHMGYAAEVGILMFWNATETTKPNMIPKAVHICHCMVKAPRMVLGVDSAE